MKQNKLTGINDYIGFTIDFETGGVPVKNCASNKANPKVNAIDNSLFLKSEEWDFTNIAITEITINCFRVKDLQMVDRLKMQVYPYFRESKVKLKKKDESTETQEYMVYDQKALDVTHISIDELRRDGLDIKEVAQKTIEFMQEHSPFKSPKTGRIPNQWRGIILGQNIQFDLGFLTQLMHRGGLMNELENTVSGTYDYWGNFQPHYLDTLDIAKMRFGDDEYVDKYKLGMIAERLGFGMCDAHDSMADTDATFNIYASCASKLRSDNAVSNDDAIFVQDKDRPHFKI